MPLRNHFTIAQKVQSKCRSFGLTTSNSYGNVSFYSDEYRPYNKDYQLDAYLCNLQSWLKDKASISLSAHDSTPWKRAAQEANQKAAYVHRVTNELDMDKTINIHE